MRIKYMTTQNKKDKRESTRRGGAAEEHPSDYAARVRKNGILKKIQQSSITDKLFVFLDHNNASTKKEKKSKSDAEKEKFEGLKSELERKQKSINVWAHGVQDKTILNRLLLSDGGEYDDPRPRLKEECVWISAQDRFKDPASVPAADIVSFCIPNEGCANKVCFHVDEIYEHVSRSAKGDIPNIWKKEIVSKIGKEYEEFVPDFISEDYGEYVKMHKRMLTINEVEVVVSDGGMTLFNRLSESLAAYVKKVPQTLLMGVPFVSFPKWRGKGGGIIPGWLKSAVMSVPNTIIWIYRNPFLVTLLTTTTVCIRMLFCAKMSGISTEDVTNILLAQLQMVQDNLIVVFLTRFFLSMYTCFEWGSKDTTLGTFTTYGGWGVALSKCIAGFAFEFFTSCRETFDQETKRCPNILEMFLNGIKDILLNWVLNPVVAYVTKFDPATIRKFTNFIGDVAGLGTVLFSGNLTQIIDTYSKFFSGEKSESQLLKETLQPFLFTYIYETAFWFSISLMPWDVFATTILRFLISFVPGLSFVVESVMEFVNLVGGTHLSVGDVIILCAYNGTMYRNIFKIYNEIKYLVYDIFKCVLETLKRNIKLYIEIKSAKILNKTTKLLNKNFATVFKQTKNIKDKKKALKKLNEKFVFERRRKNETSEEFSERIAKQGSADYACCFAEFVRLVKKDVYMHDPKPVHLKVVAASKKVVSFLVKKNTEFAHSLWATNSDENGNLDINHWL